ncbi:MAG: hypothetical protein JFR38_02585 [Muribaculaceae bacterium]|nr:hypothetical protein [Muribaculaceae bacterium]
MFKRCIAYILSITAVVANAAAHTRTDSLMHELDAAIEQREIFMAAKEARLDTLRYECRHAGSDEELFDRLGALFNEFGPYNTDSAFAAGMHRETVARRLDNPVFIKNARMNLAQVFTATGMYKEALEEMSTIDASTLPDYLLPYYYHIKRTAYGNLADFAADDIWKSRYTELTKAYRDSILRVNPPGSLTHAITTADKLNAAGRYAEAVDAMERYMHDNKLSEHERAICAWTLSVSYRNLGDEEKQKEQLLLSAISDMRSAVREYVSLRELALLLYKEGDLARAYRFLNLAVEDAAKSNARQRIIELNDIYPMVNAIYVDTISTQKRVLIGLVAVITMLLMGLVVALLRMRKQMQQLSQSRKALAEANAKLSELNGELRRYNAELSDANHSIAENSRLKEVYIGRYMDQCLSYIERLDTYRKQLGKLMAAGKTNDVKQELKSSDAIDKEVKVFYDTFDRTFLSLFPSFVDEFNRLLMPEEAIVPKKPGTLTTELRIFALIRLGISDSDKIAKFLRYSLTTIYNYRTKVRNKAAGDRSLLEAEVMKIGLNDLK